MAAFYGTFTWPTSLISPSRLATSFTGGGLLQAAKRVRVQLRGERTSIPSSPMRVGANPSSSCIYPPPAHVLPHPPRINPHVGRVEFNRGQSAQLDHRADHARRVQLCVPAPLACCTHSGPSLPDAPAMSCPPSSRPPSAARCARRLVTRSSCRGTWCRRGVLLWHSRSGFSRSSSDTNSSEMTPCRARRDVERLK